MIGIDTVSAALLVDLVDPSKLSKAERIAAISATASSLRERLAAEADRLASLRLLASKGNPPASSTMPYTSIEHSTEFRGALPGKLLQEFKYLLVQS